jgi:hypothetical protein
MHQQNLTVFIITVAQLSATRKELILQLTGVECLQSWPLILTTVIALWPGCQNPGFETVVSVTAHRPTVSILDSDYCYSFLL